MSHQIGGGSRRLARDRGAPDGRRLAQVIHWTNVPMYLQTDRGEVATGERVPGRTVCLDILRRTGACEGIDVGAAVKDIDWDGLDEALRWVDGLDADYEGPLMVLVPVPRREV